ncbi:MAG: hypothetical protein FGM52_15770, partial [Mycobacterium sp.]|nr:hypothetical protein [Mycobacterium sp.]
MTLGMGAALVGGTAVAFADTGADAATSPATQSTGSTARDAGSATSPTKRETATTRTPRGARVGTAAGDDGIPTGPTRRGQTRSAVADPEPAGTSAAGQPDPAPAAAVRTAEATDAAAGQSEQVPAVTDNTPPTAAAPVSTPKRVNARPSLGAAEVALPALPDPVDTEATGTPAATAAPAAAVAADDPAPNMDTWLPGGVNPGTKIVPGEKVKLALQQIEQSQALITEATWGAGNILAGFGAFGPQAALATAQLMLSIWGSSITNAQNFVANTVGNPLLHGLARANLQNQLLWPSLSQVSLSTAALLIPTLGWFGADVTQAEATVAAARQNGKIYAKVPVRIKLGTQPLVDTKINGGAKAALLVDTGASGLVTTRDKVGTGALGAKVGEGNSCFSGGLCYHYETYNTTVDLGDGAVGVAPVNIVTDIPGDPTYANSVANFKQFFSWGADGILGLGANTAGPGPAPIPTAAMPGELSNGVLIHQNAYPFGLGGYMILGPNLYPTRVSLPGAPDAFVKVSINGGAKQ